MVVWFDAPITTPAGVIHIATGYLLARLAGLPLITEWVLTSLVIFLCVGSLWLPVLLLQKRLHLMALSAVETGEGLDDEYRSVYRKWFWMGGMGFFGMFVIVMMMTKMTPGQLVEVLG
jgi:uncharacterized membrane protein